MKKPNKESFLKQLEEYNNFVVQNDLDEDLIDPSYDYDFDAFTSPADWAIESDRLADRLSDRKIEIKQNEDAGEFQNMELENGMPSFEAVQNMSDEEFLEYESKYLDPSNDTIAPEPVEEVSNYITDEEAVVPGEVTPPVFTSQAVRTDSAPIEAAEGFSTDKFGNPLPVGFRGTTNDALSNNDVDNFYEGRSIAEVIPNIFPRFGNEKISAPPTIKSNILEDPNYKPAFKDVGDRSLLESMISMPFEDSRKPILRPPMFVDKNVSDRDKSNRHVKDQRVGKHIKSLTMEDLYAKGMTPTDEELRDMPLELIKKLRGGYVDGKPQYRPVFLDESGQPSISNGNFVYMDKNGDPMPNEAIDTPAPVEEVAVGSEAKTSVLPAGYEEISEPSTLANVVNAVYNPSAVLAGAEAIYDTGKSIGKLYDQGQPVNALQDGARGVASGLADTAGDVLDLGGLLPNRVADFSHDSADWWRDQYEIVDSEAGSIGTNVGGEAVASVTGGAIGKVAGKVYQGMKHGGEMLRKRATVTAANIEKQAKLDPTFRKNVEDKMWGEQNILDGSRNVKHFKRKMDGSLDDNVNMEASMIGQKAYENMTKVPDRKSVIDAFFGQEPQFKRSTTGDTPYSMPLSLSDQVKKFHTEKMLDQGSKHSRGYDMDNIFEPVGSRLGNPSTVRTFDAILDNAKRKFGDRGMLQKNDAELEDLYNQGTSFDEALKIRQDRWDQIPSIGQNIGAIMGVGL